MKIFNHGDGAMPKRAPEYDIPIAELYETLVLRGISVDARGMYGVAVMLMLAINKPLPGNAKIACKMLRSDRRVYERCLAELINDGCLILLPSGEVWAPIIAGIRPSRGGMRHEKSVRDAIPKADREYVLAKTGGKCAYCAVVLTMDAGSATSFEVDHVLAVIRGGRDDIANLIPSCRACNAAKKDKTALHFFSNNKGRDDAH